MQAAQASPQLFAYHFLAPVIVTYLNDRDVLCRLIITGSSVKHALPTYRLKRRIDKPLLDSLSKQWALSTPYFPVHIVRVGNIPLVPELGLVNQFPSVEDIEFSHSADKLTTIPPSRTFMRSAVKRIKLPCLASLKLHPGSLPERLEYLSFHDYEHRSSTVRESWICSNIFPDSLIELKFGHNSNVVLQPGSLPSSLKLLEFDNTFNRPIVPGVIPSTVFNLTVSLGDNFDQELVPGSLPYGVRSVKFGIWFDKPLDHLPLSVTDLTLGFGYSSDVVLPASVTKLTLPRSLNANHGSVTASATLTELVLGTDNEPLLPGLLPVSLIKLTIRQPLRLNSISAKSKSVNQSSLPVPNLISMTYDYWTVPPAGAIPSSIQFLKLSHCDQPVTQGTIPSSVVSLELDHMKQAIQVNSIPVSVQYITLRSHFEQNLAPDLITRAQRQALVRE